MTDIRILPYDPAYASHFDRLNRDWIQTFFWVEPFDEQMLTRPQEMIIDKGGEIWFAELDGEIIGASALLYYAPGIFEFSKLGVDKKARGRKIGQKLLRHIIDRARERGAHNIYIFTNSSLKTACDLYRAEGFTDLQLNDAERARYQRADTFLELPLTSSSLSASA